MTDKKLIANASPIVKWAGGKRALLPEIRRRMPARFNHYWEPFTGGGALFFDLRPDWAPEVCHLSDANKILIETYCAVRDDLETLLGLLRVHAVNHEAATKKQAAIDEAKIGQEVIVVEGAPRVKKHDNEYYYHVRSLHESESPVIAAARFLYLNRTCYNGLWRVNSKGQFNVPVGRYDNPSIVQEDNLRAVSAALQGVSIQLSSYADVKPASGDFVYFDPPYEPLNATSFTKYHESDFGKKQQTELRDFAISLHEQGVKVMLSNSHAPLIQELYSGAPFNYQTVKAPRFVGRSKESRASVDEALITTY